jgi:hypothetical protein
LGRVTLIVGRIFVIKEDSNGILGRVTLILGRVTLIVARAAFIIYECGTLPENSATSKQILTMLSSMSLA